MRLQRWLSILPLRLRSLFRRGRVENELDDELRDHVERQTAENISRGLPPDEARRQALLAFDGVERCKEECRDARGLQYWEQTRQDGRYAWRTLRRTPFFSAIAIATLALGIGANTAMFSAVYTLLLKPLPFPNPDDLVYLWCRQPSRGIQELPPSIPDYWDWQKQLKSFDAIGGFWRREYAVGGTGTSGRVPGMMVFSSYFSVLGLPPTLGRVLNIDDEKFGRHRVVVISDALWKGTFGGDRSVVGRTIMMDSEPYTIVGVMPAAAASLNPRVQMWTPIAVPPDVQLRRIDRFMRVIGRIRPGVARDTAGAELGTVMSRLASTYEEDRGVSSYLVPVPTQMTDAETRRELFVLVGAVGMLLLIACVNIANLISVRSAVREREFALRVALGVSRWRLARQLLTEHLLLAFAGAAVALALAALAVAAIRSFASQQIPRAALVTLDVPVLLFALALTIATALAFGLLPALKASQAASRQGLQQDSRVGAGPAATRVRKFLITIEVALSVALLTCAGLLLNSFLHMRAVNPGFAREGRLVAEIDLPDVHYRDDNRKIQFFSALLARVAQLPDAASVAATETLPLHPGNQTWTGFERAGFPAGGFDKMPDVTFAHVTPGYFRTMGIPVVRGRDFSDRDTQKSELVAVISEELARRFFRGDDPVGSRIRLGADPGEPWLTVVGVVGDVSLEALDRPQPPYVYVPVSQDVHGLPSDLLVVIQTRGNPLALAPALRAAVQDLDRTLAIASLSTVSEVVSDSLYQPRLTATLMLLFAAAAALLAAIGIYGVLAYAVAQRTKEIGIRLALGATAGEIARLVISEGLRTTVAGTLIGVVLALAASRALSALLFKVTALDVPTYAAAIVSLLALAAVASFVPARRASRTDPVVSLRLE